MRATALVSAFLLSFALSLAPALSQDSSAPPPALKLPAEVKGLPQAEIIVKAETTAKKVGWKSLSPGLMIVSRQRLLDQREMVCFACAPGRYRLAAWCASPDGDVTDQVETVVVVGGTPPPPPDPVVPDPLTSALQIAYDADQGVGKDGHLRDLKAVWKLAPGLCDVRNDGNDPTTVGALIDVIRVAAASLTKDALKGVRTRIADELKVALPDPTAPLTDDLRARAKAAFFRISAALERVK